MKTIKQLVTVMVVALFMMTSFSGKSQTKEELTSNEVGELHNIVLKELMKNDEKTRLLHKKNPILVQQQIIGILMKEKPNYFDEKELTSIQSELNTAFSELKVDWRNKDDLSTIISYLEKNNRISKSLATSLFSITKDIKENRNTDAMNKINSLNKTKQTLPYYDRLGLDVYVSIFNASYSFWNSNQYHSRKDGWSYFWDAAGGLLGAGLTGGWGAAIGGPYASYMCDLYNK